MSRQVKLTRATGSPRRSLRSATALIVPAAVLAFSMARPATPPAANPRTPPGNSGAASGGVAVSGPDAVLDPAAVPAAGRHEAIIEVSRFGRYAVTVESAQGTALQIVDRMAGPGETRGTTGEADGRLDLFLDRGEYKVIAVGPEKGKGQARLSIRPFLDRSATPTPMLVELKPVEDRLADFERISYGLEIAERRRVILEAAGRDLADLRLFRNASWLVDAEPLVETIEPKPGRRLTLCRLTVELEPGAYLVTAYGGAARPWAEDSSDHPFYLRFGVPTLGEAGRERFVSSPFGFDRFLVPAGANLYRLELPEPRSATLNVQPYDPEKPFATGGPSQDITKNTSPPVAELELGLANRSRESALDIVSVRAEAGLPYVLQHFEWSDRYTFEATGDYWISTVRTGAATDSIDSTVLVVRSEPLGQRPPTTDQRPQPVQPFLSQAVEVDESHGWARRCNLLGPSTVFVHVRTAGKYQVLSSDAEARFRFEPFLLAQPSNYQPPPLQARGFPWDLEPGYYTLSIAPEKHGIVDITIRPSGILDSVKHLVGIVPTPDKPAAAAASVLFPQVHLEESRRYTAFHNQIPEVKVGFVLRRLPIDLRKPLPVAQRGGETVVVPFEAEEPGVLRAEAEDGKLLDIAIDGEPPRTSPAVAKGPHRATVALAGATTVQYALRLEPLRLDPKTPLPAATDATLTAPPAFPVLTTGTSTFLDLDRDASATYLVRADEAGLYRLQTTGLLATGGNLRTRMVTSFDRQAANGVGRNFLIQQYLREGDYQVTVATQGASKGHLGLRLDRTKLTDGGDLVDDAPARVTVSAGEAVAYRFEIREAGDYRLHASALSGDLRCRLEDEGGWPILPPGGAAEIARRFEPGRYRLVVLPEAVTTRIVTLLERVRPPLHFEGHGPHDLPLGNRVEHVWLEPEAGGERVPDTWIVRVPSAIDAAIDLTGEMQGSLRREGDAQAGQVAFVPPGRGWKGALEPGTYRLEAICSRRNNRANYQLEVRAEQLVAGTSRAVTAPAIVPVSVGHDGLVVIESSGSSDVGARLYDSGRRLVASNDDRTDDWNFQIAARLPKGAYRLEVKPVGADRSSCTVVMIMPDETEEPPLTCPVARDIEPGGAVRLFPLELGGRGDVLIVAARAREAVTLGIEMSIGGAWSTVGTASGREVRVAVPTGTDVTNVSPRFRLRLWSEDPRSHAVHLTAVHAEAPRFSESRFEKGAVVRAMTGIDPPVGLAAVSVSKPGTFRLEATDGKVRWSAERGRGFEDVGDGVVPVQGSTMWLAVDLAGGEETRTVRGSRVVLRPGIENSVGVTLPTDTPAVCDLDVAGEGPVTVVVNSTVGMPGVSVEEKGEAPFQPRGDAMAVGTRSAIGVALAARKPVAVVWTAIGVGEPIEVRLVQQHYPPPEPERTSFGSSDGGVSGFVARAFDLPSGPKRIRLTLGGGIVAVLSNGNDVQSVHWSGGAPLDELVESGAARLTLLHLQKQEDRFSLEMLPLERGEASTALAVGSSYERVHTTFGTLRLRVAPHEVGPSGRFTIHVRTADSGASEAADAAQPVLVENDGRVERGTDVPLGMDGGALMIPHPPGLVLAWVDQPGEEARGLWGDRGDVPTRDVSPPAVVPLSGATQILRLNPSGPTLLHLRAASPMLTRLQRGQETPEVRLHSSGCVLDAYLPGGAAEIGLRGIAGGGLSGVAELTTTPVTPIGEGLGPRTLLAAGGSRAFSFNVPRKGEVGVGVRASSDLATSTLLDAGGKELGSGLIQMPTLEPGTYVLVVRLPSGSRPATVRPAVAGLVPPDTGPPDEVIRSYLEKAGLRPAAAEGSPAPRRESESGQEPEPDEGAENTAPDAEGGE